VKALSGKQLCKLLERRGWVWDRTSGSHQVYGRPGSRVKISVPVHWNQSLGKGLQHQLMKEAGLTDADL
jgi:predicted RNA binding protein YcfA (HicA-like mRNA interferase family)